MNCSGADEITGSFPVCFTKPAQFWSQNLTKVAQKGKWQAMNRLIKILNKILAISDQVYIKMTIVHDEVKLLKKHKDILIYHINRVLKTMWSSKKACEKQYNIDSWVTKKDRENKKEKNSL